MFRKQGIHLNYANVGEVTLLKKVGYFLLSVMFIVTSFPVQNAVAAEKSDQIAPVTQSQVIGTMGNGGYYISAVQIHLSAVDNFSGVQRTEYSLNNGGSWSLYTTPVLLETDGIHRFLYRSVDHQGNVEKTKSLKINIDCTPPETPNIQTSQQDPLAGNFNVVVYPGSDEVSGYYKTEYRIGANGPWQTYTDPILMNVNGSQEVFVRSFDLAGNVIETSVTLSFTPDIIPPSEPYIQIVTEDWVNRDIHVSIIPGTDNESGVQKTEYRLSETEDWITYDDPFKITDEGMTTIYARTVDMAGNASQIASVTVRLDKTKPTPSTIQIDPQDWTNTSATVTIVPGEDSGSQVVGSMYKTADEEEWNYYFEPITIETEGQTQVQAATKDYAGNLSDVTVGDVKIDKTPPTKPKLVATPVLGESLEWYTSDVAVEIIAGEDALSGVERSEFTYEENGEWREYSSTLTVDQDGIHQIYARMVDRAGNASEVESLTLKIDQTPPTEPTIHLSDTDWVNHAVTVSVYGGSDATSGVRTVEYKLGHDGQWIEFTGEFIVDFEGETTVYARTIDNAGNISEEATAIIRIDKTKPEKPVINLSKTSWTYEDVTVSIIHGNDLLSGPLKSQYKIGTNGQWMDYVYAFQVIDEGITQIFSRTIDRAGNISDEQSATVKIDRTPPSAPTIAVQRDAYSWTRVEDFTDYFVQTEADVFISGGGDNESGLNRIQYRIGEDGQWVNYLNPFHVTLNYSGIVVYARAVDNAGNTSNIFVVSVPIYRVRHHFQYLSLSGSGSGEITFGPPLGLEITDIISVVFFENGIFVQYSYKLLSGDIYITTHRIEPGYQEIIDFKWDNEAPSAPENVKVSAKGNTSVTLTWSASTDNYGVTGYNIYERGKFIGSSDTTVFTVGGLAPETLYYFTIKAKDAAGNLSNASNRLVTMASPDTEAPSTPTGLTATNITDSSVQLSWEPSTDNVAVVEYDIYQDGEYIGSSFSTSYTITGLMPETEYSFSVRAKDADGNLSPNSLPVTLTTDPDYTAPSTPTDVVINRISETSAILSWTESTDNVGVVEYNIYQDGQLIGTSISTQYLIQGLSVNYLYTFTVTAKDARDNESAASEPVTYIYIVGNYTLATTNSASAYVKSDGTVWTWGSNTYGELGDGSTTPRSTALQISGLNEIHTIVAGSNHFLALKNDGTVWAWGYNGSGQLGDGTTTNRRSPVQVPNLTDVIAIAAGSGYTVALKSDGTVWAWGLANNGRLGNGVTSGVFSSPVQVTGLTGVVAISASSNGATTLALKSDGTVWGWGDGSRAQLGSGGASDNPVPIQVNGLSGIRAISMGTEHGLAVKQDGTLWAWGNNGYGQLGDGTNDTRYTPIQITDGIKGISAGRNSSMAIKTDGTVWTWGDNYFGQLGDGTTTLRLSPVKINGLANVTAVAMGYNHALAMTSGGTVWAWGNNSYGQLGNGTTTNSSTPVAMVENMAPVVTLVAPTGTQANPTVVNIEQPSISWQQNDASLTVFTAFQVQILSESGTMVLDSGVIDQNTTSNSGSWTVSSVLPVNQKLQVKVRVSDGVVWSEWSPVGWMLVSPSLTTVPGVAAGGSYSLALKADGTVWAWGENSYGQLGDGTTTSRTTAIQIPGLSEIVQVSVGGGHSVALKNDGTVWTWGYNGSGQLGDGTTTNRRSPVQVPNLTDVIAIAAGSGYTVALKSDGTVWAWGLANNGRLGNGVTSGVFSSPVQVTGLTGVVAISASSNGATTLALKSDGTVWGWGDGSRAQLGSGGASDNPVPIQVNGLSGIRAISMGTEHGLAVKQDGTLWAWGNNGYGQLGDGTNDTRYTPIQITDGIKGISAGRNSSMAIKTDGTVWTWGDNYFGQLGDGTTTLRLSPVKINGLANVTAVAMGYNHALAMTSDGTVWAWGNNSYGQLGNGTTTNSSTPVRSL